MRKKTTHTLDTAALTKAWDDFFEENKVFTKEQLNAKGWMSINDIAKKTGFSERSVLNKMGSSTSEKKKFLVKHNCSVREMNFYRLKA
jgi:hypothetical protein